MMPEIVWEASMLYLAGLLFLGAISLWGADLAGIRAAHHAGVTGTLLFLVALLVLVAKDVQVVLHDYSLRHNR